jgi:hypothetical protein
VGEPPPPRFFFQIPVERIVVHRVAWFAATDRLAEDQVEPFGPARYTELPGLSDEYSAYLRQARRSGEPPLLFHRVAHVLVLGAIDVRGVPVIAWDVAPQPATLAGFGATGEPGSPTIASLGAWSKPSAIRRGTGAGRSCA